MTVMMVNQLIYIHNNIRLVGNKRRRIWETQWEEHERNRGEDALRSICWGYDTQQFTLTDNYQIDGANPNGSIARYINDSRRTNLRPYTKLNGSKSKKTNQYNRKKVKTKKTRSNLYENKHISSNHLQLKTRKEKGRKKTRSSSKWKQEQ